MITLTEIQQHHTEPIYQFLIRTVNDLWENYIYNVLELNNPDVNTFDIDDIGFFREWLDQKQLTGFVELLPQSDSTMQAIVKYCYNQIDD